MSETTKERQVIFWRLLSATFTMEPSQSNLESLTEEIVDSIDMPRDIMDSREAPETLMERYPEVKPDFDAIEAMFAPAEEGKEKVLDDESDLRRGLAYSKILLSVMGPNSMAREMSAAGYSEWCKAVGMFEKCLGFAPGSLRSGRPGMMGPGVSGMTPGVSDADLQAGLKTLEGDIIKRMKLREVLKDDRMAAQLSPSIELVEELLRDKSNLSGNALKNAKMLIRSYVDQVAEVLKTQVRQAVKGRVDRSIPPKRVFRNLDLKKTLWKNLTNYDPNEKKLYVDRLFYRQTGSKTMPEKLIVVVDQSGSMLNSMVQTAILASIFSSLPRVDVVLIAFDHNFVDLTDWVRDPFEVLMRTNLGGGNEGPKAMTYAQTKIVEPKHTTMVWISDFYEFHNDRPLFEMIKAVKESGVRFIPVGALQSSGYFNLNEFFRVRLKEIGTPVLSGNIKKLIHELRDLL